MRPCVRCATLDGYVGLARPLGLDPAAIMTGAGLDVADLARPDKWIPAADVARVLHISAEQSGCEAFGLRVAELRRLATLGPLSVVLREEPDLRSALDLLTRYQRSYNEALRLRVSESKELVTIAVWLEFGEPAPARQALELAVAALHGIIKGFLGDRWEPLSVCFSHSPPADRTTHHRLMGARVRFDQDFSGLVMYASDLDARSATSDPLMRPYAQQILESVLPQRAATTTDRVRELVEFLLPLSRCSMQQVARNIGVNSRTLHRQLGDSGESFSSIVHSVRASLAERYLTNERYSLTDVSQLLGFSAPSAFTRWFHQQFHVCPSEWRAAAGLVSSRQIARD